MTDRQALPAHVQASAIVLEEVRLVYVPIPKAGSTAILWGLADLVGITGDAFTRSTKLETTRALTIHDFTIWGRSHLLDGRWEDGYELMAASDWFAFTVVRDPVRRLWSGWVSKVLVRDPRFVRLFGEEPWFPEPPRTAYDVVRSFRHFVEAVSESPAEMLDPHWSSQAELAGVDELPYDLVARTERLPGDLGLVNDHLRELGRGPLELRRENTSLLPFIEEVFDELAWEQCAALTARDRDVFGYEMPERTTGEPYEEWVAEIEARLPGINAVIERNERIGDLKHLLPSTRAS
jgi:hypothetical protein